MPTAAPNVLLVGDFPPPYGGVAVHVELVRRAVRARGGRCTVLDIGKGQVLADGVVAAGGYAGFAARLFAHALGGPLIHVHTSGANPKSWALAAACAAAARVARVPPLITFHSGLGPGWLAEEAARARVACAVANAFGKVIAGGDVYVRPTFADGDSVSVREAVALGRTVVATSVGTRPREAILVPPGDPAALAAALLQAAEARPALRVARGTDVELNEDCVRRLLELYGFAAHPEPAPVRQNISPRATTEEPACAASAAS